MDLLPFILLQLIVSALGFLLLWRKLDRIGADVARIKSMLGTLELMRLSKAAQTRSADTARAEPALASAAVKPAPSKNYPHHPSVWRAAQEDEPSVSARGLAPTRAPGLRPIMANDVVDDASIAPFAFASNRQRIIVAILAVLTPLLALIFDAPLAGLVVAGFAISAGLLLLSLRAGWEGVALVAPIAVAGWAVTALAMSSAQESTGSFVALVVVAGLVGLTHFTQRSGAPGVVTVLVSGAALAALGHAIGFDGPAGIGFGLLIIAAAVSGAARDQFAGLHLGAFAAGLIGLYVFSGQAGAAIWFTPAAAWFGALFLAIAAIRVPTTGAKGATFAATGVAAPLLSAGGLWLSQHGLADPLAAAGALATLAAVFAGLMFLAAQRDRGGLSGLHISAWILLSGALIAFAFSAALAFPAPIAATIMAAGALGLVCSDHRDSRALWRAGAVALFLASGASAISAVAHDWPSLLEIAGALLAPTLLAGTALLVSKPRAALTAYAFIQGLAICGAVASAAALARLALSAGEPNRVVIGFVEAGFHLALWAWGSLALAVLWRRTRSAIFGVGAGILAIAALGGAALAGAFWLTPFWSGRAPSGVDLGILQHAPLGFALPALAAWTHFAYWRKQGVVLRTRTALAAAALLTASFISLELYEARSGDGLDGPLLALTAIVFALAIGVNFAPGVTDTTGARLRLDKYFQRNRRGQQRI